MEHDPFLHRLEQVPHMRRVIRLCPHDAGLADPHATDAIFAAMPPDKAEDHILALFGQLSSLADRIGAARRRLATSDIPPLADEAAVFANVLGLIEAELVAGHVADCAKREDHLGLSACVARLDRLIARAPRDLFRARTGR